jgi:hypothetical protein
MYVIPRPQIKDDPLYAYRLAFVGLCSYLAVVMLNPVLPPIIAALPVGMIAAQRKSFNLAQAVGGPVAMIVLTLFMAWLMKSLEAMPLVYVCVAWFFYYLGFYAILKTGEPGGMLIVIITVLMSVMGMHGNATVDSLRDGFVQASLVALVLGPLAYLLFPAGTQERFVPGKKPSDGRIVTGAIIRATVLLLLSFWLYSVMQPADMMMAVIAAMVLVFPTRSDVFSEAKERILATFYGAVMALAVLLVFVFSPHLTVLLALIFLGCWVLANGALTGRHASNVYLYGISVAMSLIAGSLSTQDAGYATLTRIVLTLVGAFAAALLVALLDALTDWRSHQLKPAKDL